MRSVSKSCGDGARAESERDATGREVARHGRSLSLSPSGPSHSGRFLWRPFASAAWAGSALPPAAQSSHARVGRSRC